MTTSGSVTPYSLPGASTNTSHLQFVVGPDGNFWAPFAYGSSNLVVFSTNGSVVSTKPLPYAVPWSPFEASGNAIPRIGNIITDPSGYIFLTDWQVQGVLRIDSNGNLVAYPTYSTLKNIVDNPLYILQGSNGTHYLSSTAVLNDTQAGLVQALTPIDTSLW